MESARYSTIQCFNPFKKSDHRVRDKKKATKCDRLDVGNV